MKAVNYIEQRLGIKKPADWGNVTTSLVMNVAGGIMRRHSNSIQSFLAHIYPDIDWQTIFEFRSTSKHTSKAHAFLLKQVFFAFIF